MHIGSWPGSVSTKENRELLEMVEKQLRSGSGKFSSAKKIAKSKRLREHLALAHNLNENNESIVGTSNSDQTPKFIIEGCRI